MVITIEHDAQDRLFFQSVMQRALDLAGIELDSSSYSLSFGPTSSTLEVREDYRFHSGLVVQAYSQRYIEVKRASVEIDLTPRHSKLYIDSQYISLLF